MPVGRFCGQSLLRCIWWKGSGLLSVFLLLLSGLIVPARAQGPVLSGEGEGLSSDLRGLVSDDPDVQAEALQALAEKGDPAALPLLTALYEGALRIWTSAEGTPRVVILGIVKRPDSEEKSALFDPLTGEILKEWDDTAIDTEGELAVVSVGSPEGRRLLQSALDRLKLFDPSAEVRRSAATKIGNEGDPSVLPFLGRVLARETDKWVLHAVEEAIDQLRLSDPNPLIRREAALHLGEIKGLQALPRLKALLSEEPIEPDKEVRKAIRGAIERIEAYQQVEQFVGVIFSGMSLGSILLLMGLGLSVIFGLMGVINMAHGEMMMIGGYTAFVVQEVSSAFLPPAFHDFSFIAALPLSFVFTGLVGLALEKSVIRFLYGRPLETLLATWGVSLILQQAGRWYFGDLTSVNTPTWMRGGVPVMGDLVFPYNRIFIIVLSVLCVFGVHLLLSRTRWGLRIRAVTQNRDMSACVGISTRRVDSWTFALGAGVAGLAGCALSLIGNVDPEMGKTYIVDSFMVVVVGGVGKLAGTVVSAMGIGLLNKILEPIIGGTAGAIYAKLFILGAIILFLQSRPSGLFPAKGRAAQVS